MKKKKILFVGSFKDKAKDGSVGGQMFACKSLLNSSFASGYEFILIDSTADSVPAPPVYKRLFKAVLRVLRTVLYLSCRRIDVVFIFSSAGFSLKEKGVMVLLGRLFSKQVFFFPRSGLIRDDLARNGFNRWFTKQVIRQSDYVICQGTFWRRFYQRFDRSNTDKFVVLPNWIDTTLYKPANRKYNDVPVILYLGWLEPYKGILDIVDVSLALAGQGIKFVVEVYGSGSLESQIRHFVKDHQMENYFHINGWADKSLKIKALGAADIFVLPSYREGFPNALLEAMASGLPSIGSNVGGVPDLIDHGINGFIIKPGDKVMFGEYLTRLITSSTLRQSLFQESITKVKNNNSVEKAWLKLDSLINKAQ